ncbi:hypothetical protein KQ940_21775 [Marinobacterium sp. D7]|nr:hypothetical protein [Marinobacterium ramblicola]MBV1790699.1 hypothetical protein [Marinobacterium ramblicola]
MQFVDNDQINWWAISEQSRFVDSVPVFSIGKLDKKRIRSQLADQF